MTDIISETRLDQFVIVRRVPKPDTRPAFQIKEWNLLDERPWPPVWHSFDTEAALNLKLKELQVDGYVRPEPASFPALGSNWPPYNSADDPTSVEFKGW